MGVHAPIFLFKQYIIWSSQLFLNPGTSSGDDSVQVRHIWFIRPLLSYLGQGTPYPITSQEIQSLQIWQGEIFICNLHHQPLTKALISQAMIRCWWQSDSRGAWYRCLWIWQLHYSSSNYFNWYHCTNGPDRSDGNCCFIITDQPCMASFYGQRGSIRI